MTKRGKKVDDRGRSITRPAGRRAKAGTRDVREQYRLITYELNELSMVRVMLWDMVRVCFASVVFAVFGYTMFVSELLYQSYIFFGIAGVLIVFTAMRPAFRRKQIRRLQRAQALHRERLAAHRCCFACEYDLDGLQPESDGCTVCPECGGAWKLGSLENTKADNPY